MKIDVTAELEQFKRSPNKWLIMDSICNFYSSRKSAQTTWAITIKRLEYDMECHCIGNDLLIVKRGKRHAR